MPFFLKHHFDPDLGHQALKPRQQDDGSVDHYELDFVQNVEAGSVIARWIKVDDDSMRDLDPRFIHDEIIPFPAGKGTGIKRQSPDKLYAAVNGGVAYLDGKIVVQENLAIPDDIDFHTGNINFIGNLTVGGCVRGGFTVQGRDIRILGQIEGARIEALRDLACRGGVKGGKEAFLEAGKGIKLSFCENATLKSGDDIMVKGTLMHSNVYCGRRLAVGGRLTGGHIYCHENIYVGGQLGGGLDTDTSLILGYDPTLLYADAEYNRRIKNLIEKIASCEKSIERGDDSEAECVSKLEAARRELELLKMLKVKLWEGIHGTERVDRCKVLVPGVVKPGVEISIGSAFFKVDDYLEDVYFYYDNGEVAIGTSAKKMKR